MYLSFVVGSDQLKIDPSKIQTIMNWPRPSNLTEVRSFVGAYQYLHKFIPHFSNIATPLHALTKGETKFVWTKTQEQAFNTLKQKICEAPVLGLSNLQNPFEIEADASGYAIGAILMQDGRSITYHSETFLGVVLNYPMYDRELYAMLQVVKNLWAYILGKETVIHTDHKPLFCRHSPSCSRHAKWMSYLQQFNLVIKYKKGVTNKIADLLSRPPKSTTLIVVMQLQPFPLEELHIQRRLRFPSDYGSIKNRGVKPDFYLQEGLLYKDDKLCVPHGDC
eukprot:Gb_18698 [translate_table: standard]